MQKVDSFCTAGFDYVRISFPSGDGSVCDWLPGEGFSPPDPRLTLSRVVRVLTSHGYPVDQFKASRGHYGYKYAVRDPLDRFTIYSDLGDKGSGILFQMSGFGCDLLDPVGIRSLCFDLYSIGGGWFTRIDPKVDLLNFGGSRLIDQLNRAYKKGYLGRVHDFEPFLKLANKKVANKGCGIGNRGSDKYVRVYDKGLELGALPEGALVRCEPEFKGDRARKLGRMLLVSPDKPSDDDLADWIVSVVFGSFPVSKPSKSGKNKPVRWYADLMRRCSCSVSLAVPCKKRVRSYEKRVSWEMKSVLPFAAAVVEPFGCSVGDYFNWRWGCSSSPSVVIDDSDNPCLALARKEFSEYISASFDPNHFPPEEGYQ